MVIYILYIFSRLLAVPRAGCRKSDFFFYYFLFARFAIWLYFSRGGSKKLHFTSEQRYKTQQKNLKKIQQELPYIRYINILRQDFFYIIYFFSVFVVVGTFVEFQQILLYIILSSLIFFVPRSLASYKKFIFSYQQRFFHFVHPPTVVFILKKNTEQFFQWFNLKFF